MQSAKYFLQTHKRTLFFLQLPQFSEEKKKEMVVDLIHYFSLPITLQSIIMLLLKHNRSFYLPEVLSSIIELYDEETNSIEFFCYSTQMLMEQHKKNIQRFLESLLNKHIVIISDINTSLIAGLRLMSKDHLWEYSVRKNIRALQALKREDSL